MAADQLRSCQRSTLTCCAGDKLLANKQHAQLLEPYAQRKAAAEAYMKAVRPGLQVSGGPLLDPKVSLCTVCTPAQDAVHL